MNTENQVLNKVGEVRVADEVMLAIAGLAATEVEGVSYLGKTLNNASIARAGKGTLSKYVLIEKKEGGAYVSLEISVDGQIPIPTVSRNVEEHVKDAIGSMTGLKVEKVNVKIVGVAQ